MLGVGRGIQNYYYIILAGLLALAIIIALWVRSERGSKSL